MRTGEGSSALNALEKVNERVVALIASGVEQNEDARLANEDASLGRFIPFALLCTYGELASERDAGVRSGTRLGASLIPENMTSRIQSAWFYRRRLATSDVTLMDIDLLRICYDALMENNDREVTASKFTLCDNGGRVCASLSLEDGSPALEMFD